MKRGSCVVMILATLFFRADLSKAQAEFQCPNDPDKIRSMVRELKDTFECGGLNFKSCNQYRAGLVGGGLAATTAAGLAVLKRNSAISCMLPGATSAMTSSQRNEFLARVLFGAEAEAAIASMPPKGCAVSKQTLVKELDGLKKDFTSESQRISSEMKDRMLAQKVPPADLAKIEVTPDDWRKKFSSGIDALEKEVKAMTVSDPAAKQRLLDAIALERRSVADASLKAVSGQVAFSFERIMNYMPAEIKDGLSEASHNGVKFWNITGEVRAEKAAKLSGNAAQKALTEIESDLTRLSSMVSGAERADFLEKRGYKASVIKDLIEIDNSRKALSLNASLIQMTNHELSLGAKFKNVAMVTATEMKALASKNGLRFLESPLFHFREIPGLNNGIVATISRAGKKALAEASVVGASRLGVLAKYAGPTLMTAGKAFAAATGVGAELGLHMNDAHCGGDITTKYAHLTMTENEKGKESCQPGDLRTAKTDEFLFGLSPDDQLKEVRNNDASCRMLTRLYARYAPSQNWQLTCSSGPSGPTARLNGKNAKAEGQMISFVPGDQLSPQNLEWYSTTFERCAKVELKAEEFESAQVYPMETGMSSCGSVGTANTLRKNVLTNRQVNSDDKKMIQEFYVWQNSNSAALGMAAECCSGRGTNAMCAQSSRPSGGSGSGPAIRGGSTRR